MDDKVKYWLEIAEYNLDTAAKMLDAKRYLYVGFRCHKENSDIDIGIFANEIKHDYFVEFLLIYDYRSLV